MAATTAVGPPHFPFGLPTAGKVRGTGGGVGRDGPELAVRRAAEGPLERCAAVLEGHRGEGGTARGANDDTDGVDAV